MSAEGGRAPITLSEALGERIRVLLEAQGWSQDEFARRLGVTQGAVSYLLGGKRRGSALDYYQRVAMLFGMSLSQLFAGLELQVAARQSELRPETQRPAKAGVSRQERIATIRQMFDESVDLARRLREELQQLGDD